MNGPMNASIRLSHIAVSQDGGQKVPVSELGGSHGLTVASAKMYDRFFGLQSVMRQSGDQTEMLAAVLRDAVAQLSDGGQRPGMLVYCKTQTHNTLSDQNWLRRLADAQGLAHWEVLGLSMTSCASALVALHFLEACSGAGGGAERAPVILLTGEKAFHPSVARLTVGLLAEVPAAAVLNGAPDPGAWQLRASDVHHLPRFHINPEAMRAEDRSALQEVYTPALIDFVRRFLDRHAGVLDPEMVFVPHNLNRPVTEALIRAFDWQHRSFRGDVAGTGHAYCSDPLLNLDALTQSGAPAPQVLLLAAGTGVTFAACLLDRARPEATDQEVPARPGAGQPDSRPAPGLS